MYAQRRLKKYSSLTGTTRIFRFYYTFTLVFCLLISGHDFPFFYSFNIYQTNHLYCSRTEFDTVLNDFESEVFHLSQHNHRIILFP